MKKSLALLLAASLTGLFLAACGGGGGSPGQTFPPAPTAAPTATPTDTPTPTATP